MFRLLKFLLIVLATATVFAVVLHQPLLSALGNLVVYESDDFDHADAAVVLCGAIPGRALQAADLLLESKADRAILTREQKPRSYQRMDELGVDYSEHHEINQAVLLRLGVDAGRINILPEKSSSTWEEARAFRNYVNQHPVESIVITTCQFHSYRAQLNFERALEGTGVQVYSVPSKYCEFSADTWWKDREQVKRLYVELASLTAFFLGTR